jgi:hypothetical protein
MTIEQTFPGAIKFFFSASSIIANAGLKHKHYGFYLTLRFMIT